MSLPVSIVIVTYNSAATIGPCLSSVLATLRRGDEVVVVDNNSRDATLEIVASLTSTLPPGAVKVIANPTNRGYSLATNQGIRSATAPLIALLNPDTVVTSGWMEHLAAHFTSDRVGAVGPVSNFSVRRQSVAHHWRGPLPSGIGPDEAATRLYAWNRGKAEKSDLLVGFCLMVRRDIVGQLGGLDERLFLGNDDLELSWRLRLHGYELWIATDVFIYHEGQHSFRSEPQSTVGRLVQESSDALYRILETSYGHGRVPLPVELWGIDWFAPSCGEFNEAIRFHQAVSLPRAFSLPTPDPHPVVSIIILTYNQRSYTEECLDSIARHTPEPHEIILVDNGSTDGTVAWLSSLADGDSRYRLIVNGENRGFAAGCNQGLAAARAEFLVLLNNDVVVTPEWLAGLLECHRAEPLAGIVGPLTNNASGIQGLGDVCPGGTGELDAFSHSYRLQHRYRRVASRRLVGFCMLFSRQLYLEIGGLDERFGTGNFEDDDFCLRSAIAGYCNVVAGDVYVHHYGSVTFKGAGVDYRATLTANWSLYREKWSSPVADEATAARIASCRTREDAERLLLEERLDEAVAMLERACREHAADRLLRQLLCRALLGAGRHGEALRMVSPGSAADLSARARSLLAEGRDSEAESLLLSAVAKDPGHGGAYLLRGYLAHRRGEEEFAQALILKGFLLSPTEPEHGRAIERMMEAPQALSPIKALVEEAALLHPQCRMLARLRVELSARSGDDQALVTAAERFIMDFGPDAAVLAAGITARRALGPWRPPASPGRSVSLCMIVRDEERHIVRCLSSCRPLVHEMVVVDTGSRDRTAELAELLGARLIHHSWRDDFAEARNVSLAAATGDWILVMDGDEALSVRDYSLFRKVLDETVHPAAFSLTSRNYTTGVTQERFTPLDGSYPEDEAGFGWTPSEKVRLFPNHFGIHFVGVVHELVESSVTSAGLSMYNHPVPVHHYGELDGSRSERNKSVMYYEMGRRKLQEGKRDQKAIYELAVQAGGMGRYQEAEELWLEFLEQNIGMPVAWFNLGYVYLRMGRVEHARVATEQALSLQPDYPAALANLAICRFCLMPPAEALAEIEAMAAACPDRVSLNGLLGLAKCLNGQVEDGIAGLRSLAARGYDMREYIASLVMLLHTVGRRAEAEVLEVLARVIG